MKTNSRALRFTEEQAYLHIDKVLLEEQELYKGRPTGAPLPTYIEEARLECHARLTGQLQHEDTIDKDLWEDMVHDTVATLREAEEYERGAEAARCNCRDPWCPC